MGEDFFFKWSALWKQWILTSIALQTLKPPAKQASAEGRLSFSPDCSTPGSSDRCLQEPFAVRMDVCSSGLHLAWCGQPSFWGALHQQADFHSPEGCNSH